MMIPLLSATIAPSSISAALFSQLQQNQFTRVPLWLWILIGLIVVAIGVIWTLWEEGDLKKKEARPALASEPVQQAASAPTAGRALAAEAKPIPPSPSEQDDLKQVLGIGPIIEQILNDHGIFTYEQLAATDVNFLESLMAEHEWHMAEPATWLAQARALAEQKKSQGRLD